MYISRHYVSIPIILFSLILQSPMASYAAMVETSALLDTGQMTINRNSLIESLKEKELQEKMVQLGVDPGVVIDRVNNMTEAEIASLNEKIHDMPAGGSLLGWFFVLFIVFIITDAIGATDIFSFVKPAD